MKSLLTEFVRDRTELEPVAPQDAPDDGFPRWGLKPCPAPAWERLHGQTVAAVRSQITEAMRRYMSIPNPDFMLLIPAPPGAGKTWAGVEHAHWVHSQTGKRVLYAGPRHDFFGDIIHTVLDQEKSANQWYEWLPRQTTDDERNTCKYAPEINLWLHKGFGGLDFCRQACGWDYVNHGCPYHAQANRKEPIVYGQHAHVLLGHPLATGFGCVIGDESPLASFIHEWRIPAKHLHWADLPLDQELTHILRELQQMAENKVHLHGRELMKMLDASRVTQACKEFSLPAGATILAPYIHEAKDADKTPYNLLPTLVPLLLREAEAAATGADYPARLYLTEHGLTMICRRYVNPLMPKHMIWFDATGQKNIFQQMFGRKVEALDVRVQMQGKIVQVTDRANGKASLQKESRVEQIKKQIAAITSKYKRPAVVTFEAIEGVLQDVDTLHFYGARGSNQMQDCDCLIVAGTPQPPLYQIEKIAKALWFERMRPFDTTRYLKNKAYLYVDKDGSGQCYPVHEYADPELNAVLWQFREAEIIQAAHRARILFRDVPVYLLTNLPIEELPPMELIDIRALLDAPPGVDVFHWPEVKQFADAQGAVTIGELMDTFGLHRHTASKYIEELAKQPGWELAAVKSDRGRAAKQARSTERILA